MLKPHFQFWLPVGRLAMLTSSASYQVLAEDSMLVTWSHVGSEAFVKQALTFFPLAGSMIVQGSILFGQLRKFASAPLGSCLRKRPMRKRDPKLWTASAETVKFCATCCCTPKMKCCTSGMTAKLYSTLTHTPK